MRTRAGSKALTTTGVAIGGDVACEEVTIQSPLSTAVVVLVGDKDGQHFELQPGEVVTLPAERLNQVWAKTASSTATIKFLATWKTGSQ